MTITHSAVVGLVVLITIFAETSGQEPDNSVEHTIDVEVPEPNYINRANLPDDDNEIITRPKVPTSKVEGGERWMGAGSNNLGKGTFQKTRSDNSRTSVADNNIGPTNLNMRMQTQDRAQKKEDPLWLRSKDGETSANMSTTKSRNENSQPPLTTMPLYNAGASERESSTGGRETEGHDNFGQSGKPTARSTKPKGSSTSIAENPLPSQSTVFRHPSRFSTVALRETNVSVPTTVSLEADMSAAPTSSAEKPAELNPSVGDASNTISPAIVNDGGTTSGGNAPNVTTSIAVGLGATTGKQSSPGTELAGLAGQPMVSPNVSSSNLDGHQSAVNANSTTTQETTASQVEKITTVAQEQSGRGPASTPKPVEEAKKVDLTTTTAVPTTTPAKETEVAPGWAKPSAGAVPKQTSPARKEEDESTPDRDEQSPNGDGYGDGGAVPTKAPEKDKRPAPAKASEKDDRPAPAKASEKDVMVPATGDNSSFVLFLVVAVAVVLLSYMAYINRAKVMAIVVEGFSGRPGSRRQSTSRSNYQYQPLSTRPGSHDDVAGAEERGGSSSGRHSPADDAVIVVDRDTLNAVKNYVY